MSRPLALRRAANSSFAKSLIDQAVQEVLRPMRRMRLVGGFVAAGAFATMPLTGAEPAPQAALGPIVPPSITVSDPVIAEGDTGTSNLVFTLTRTGDLTQNITVSYSTGATGDTATAGSDYIAASGFVDFAAGDTTKTVTVAVRGDISIEASETVTLNVDVVRVIVPGAAVGVPTYGAPQVFQNGVAAYASASADFNGDGKPDVATINATSTSVFVLLNNTAPGAGAAAFFPGQTFGIGSNPRGVTVADVNRDNKPDLIVANVSSANVSVLLNTTPDGATVPSFASQATFAVGATPCGVTTADINGDFAVDIAVSNIGSNNVSVLLNTTPIGATAPSFSPAANIGVGSNPYDVETGDFDGDGRPDLAIANRTGNNVSVLRNTTPLGATVPSFLAQVVFAVGSNPTKVTVGDLNGDGRDDIAVSNSFSDNVSILVNTFTSTIAAFAAAQNFPVGDRPYQISTGDLDGDGRPDLTVANYGSNNLSLLLNSTTTGATVAAFTSLGALPAAGGPIGVLGADIDGDTRLDLVSTQVNSSDIQVHLNNAPAIPAAFQPVQTVPLPQTVGAHEVADFNGDGAPDFAVLASSQISVFLSTTAAGATAASFSLANTFGIGTNFAFSLAAGDFNRDGRPDLAFSPAGVNNQVFVLTNTTPTGATAASFAAPVSFATNVFGGFINTADINRDGAADIIIHDGGQLSVLLNTAAPNAAAPVFAAPSSFLAQASTGSFALGDLNGDGSVDFVGSGAGIGGGLRYLRNTTPAGAMIASFAPQQSLVANAAGLALGDFNGDGLLDIALDGGSQFQVLNNITATGATTFSFVFGVTQAAFFGSGLAVADFNLDGKLDVIKSAASGTSGATVFLNNTTAGTTVASFSPPVTINFGSTPGQPVIADVNRDGRPDALLIDGSLPNSYVLLNAVAAVTKDGLGTIASDDIIVSLSSPTTSFAENGGTATVTATLATASPLDVTVNLAFAGTATLAIDYTASTTAIVIPAGSLTGSVTLTAIGDAIVEGAETVTVSIASTVNAVPVGIAQNLSITESVNAPPVISSASFSPANPTPGQAVTFTVAATDPEGAVLTIGYNYGDGSSDNTGVHSYSAPGTYTVTINVSDGVNAVTTTLTVIVGGGAAGDSDGDGFDDFIEEALLTDPNDNTSRPFELATPTIADASGLIIKKLSIRIRAGKPKLNSLILSGSLPVSGNFTPQGKPIIVSIGGVVRSFVSDKQGFSPIGTAFDKLRFARARGGRVKFDIKLTKGTFTTVAREGGSVRVIVIFEGKRYELLVTAK